MKETKSKGLFERAKKSIPGGVNSPVRAFGSVGRTPLFIKKAYGSTIVDEDNNQYIDYAQYIEYNAREVRKGPLRGPRRSPAQRVRWGEETQRNE